MQASPLEAQRAWQAEQQVQALWALVRREAAADDRRVCRVALTPKGRRLWRKLEVELLEVEEGVLRTLAPSEREAVIRAMALLAEATDAWRARQAGRPLRLRGSAACSSG